jgi:hypothetical protein
MNWERALAWAQEKNAEKYLGHSDWRLPSVKELQSMVDYTRSPDTSKTPAIDPVFTCTAISNENRQLDYPFYWSGTTHGGFLGGSAAMYVAFGRAAGWMSPRGIAGGPPDRRGPGAGAGRPPGPGGPGMGFGPPPGFGPGPGPEDLSPRERIGAATNSAAEYHYVDVHGAGAQRSDPKSGDPAMFPHGRGPQGDVIRIYNFVRLVRTETK